MKRKRKLNHHKPNHNGINRKTGKRVPNNRAFEPGDGNKKNKPKKDISVDEAERRDLLKQKRAEYANLIRQDWLRQRQEPAKPCCETDEDCEAKNNWLMKQLESIRCETIVDTQTGIKVGRVIPLSFERRPDVWPHMRHFAKVAKEAGYTRHW